MKHGPILHTAVRASRHFSTVKIKLHTFSTSTTDVQLFAIKPVHQKVSFHEVIPTSSIPLKLSQTPVMKDITGSRAHNSRSVSQSYTGIHTGLECVSKGAGQLLHTGVATLNATSHQGLLLETLWPSLYSNRINVFLNRNALYTIFNVSGTAISTLLQM